MERQSFGPLEIHLNFHRTKITLIIYDTKVHLHSYEGISLKVNNRKCNSYEGTLLRTYVDYEGRLRIKKVPSFVVYLRSRVRRYEISKVFI